MYKVLILLVSIFLNVGAQLSLRNAMRAIKVNKNSQFIELMMNNILNRYLWLGAILYVFSFLLYLIILSKYEVSYIYPIITASIFMLLIIFSSLLLNESITISKVIGMGVIVLGIFIASKG